MRIFQTVFKDIIGIVCETHDLTAVFLPGYGAKLASLISRTDGRELLEQTPGKRYRTPVYGGSYVEAECSAFDDMLPTIDACFGEAAPWKGIEYPDHGEVYALRWIHEVAEDCLHMWVYSVRFGYRLDKWVYEEDSRLVIRYQLENLTDFEFPYIYAAHCMLAARDGMRLELPYVDGARITTVFCDSGRLGKYGTKGCWPVTGQMDLSVIPGEIDERKRTELSTKSERGSNICHADTYKFFFEDPVPIGSCICHYPDRSQLVFRFDEKELPYLGVWINTGGFQGKYNVALEPCSGAFDRPDLARLHGKESVLGPKEQKVWELSFAYRAGCFFL